MQEITRNDKMDYLISEIEKTVAVAKEHLTGAVNQTMTETYWRIGRYIVEFEQFGNEKAIYGKNLLSTLSKELTLRLGKGYSRPNLNNMRKFYLKYPNCQTVSDKLSWSHICELIKIDDDLERSFYEKQCVKERWIQRYSSDLQRVVIKREFWNWQIKELKSTSQKMS